MIADGHGHVMSGISLAIKTLLIIILPATLTKSCIYDTLFTDWSTQIPEDYKLWIPLLDNKFNCTNIGMALLKSNCMNQKCANNISCNKTSEITKELYMCLTEEDPISCPNSSESQPQMQSHLFMNLSEFKKAFADCLSSTELTQPPIFTCLQGIAASSTSTTTTPTTTSTTTTPTTTTSTTDTTTTSTSTTDTTTTSTISTPSPSTVRTNNEPTISNSVHAFQSFNGKAEKSVLGFLMLSVILNLIFLGLLLKPRQKPPNTCEHCGLSEGQRFLEVS